MTTGHITVAGVPAISITLHQPGVGPWWADCILVDDTDVTGAVTIAIGDSLELSGTVVTTRGGVFAAQRTCRVVAGGAGWATLLGPAAYHNDGGVSALRVATDAAQACGEALGNFAPTNATLPSDYVRDAGAAARTLEDLAGDASWWVDFSGVTHVGARDTSTPQPGSYELLEYDPINRVATLAMDDLASVTIGTVLAADERLVTAQTVRALRFEISGGDARVIATCGETDARSRVVRALRAMARRSVDERYYGVARYRVIRMNGDRVELQAVTPGMPDIGPISMAPGAGGAHSELAGGTVVLVQFIEGLRSMPMITHFAGKDGAGYTPVNTTIAVQTLLKLGASATQFVALASDVKARIDTLQNAHDTHTHPYVAGVGAPIAGAPPAAPIGPLAGVAATKVKAE